MNGINLVRKKAQHEEENDTKIKIHESDSPKGKANMESGFPYLIIDLLTYVNILSFAPCFKVDYTERVGSWKSIVFLSHQ